MTKASIILALVMIVSQAADAWGQFEAHVKLEGPLLVGFFPPVTQKELDDPMSGAAEGMAHVRFALEDALKCLQASGISAKATFVVARSIIIDEGTNSRRHNLPTSWSQSVGVYLLNPGKPDRAVYAEDGPSSLVVLAPTAAGEYFNAPKCK
jgi:hypothetical protein